MRGGAGCLFPVPPIHDDRRMGPFPPDLRGGHDWRGHLQPPVATWHTPHGEIVGRVHEQYTGLADQPRIALVDRHGRVHHFDARDVVRLR